MCLRRARRNVARGMSDVQFSAPHQHAHGTDGTENSDTRFDCTVVVVIAPRSLAASPRLRVGFGAHRQRALVPIRTLPLSRRSAGWCLGGVAQSDGRARLAVSESLDRSAGILRSSRSEYLRWRYDQMSSNRLCFGPDIHHWQSVQGRGGHNHLHRPCCVHRDGSAERDHSLRRAGHCSLRFRPGLPALFDLRRRPIQV